MNASEKNKKANAKKRGQNDKRDQSDKRDQNDKRRKTSSKSRRKETSSDLTRWHRLPTSDSTRLQGGTLKLYGKYGVYGAGAMANQPGGRPRPLAPRGIRGFAMCCAGLGLGADVGGPGCCPLRTPCSSTYQCRPPRSMQLAGRTAPPIPGQPKCVFG